MLGLENMENICLEVLHKDWFWQEAQECQVLGESLMNKGICLGIKVSVLIKYKEEKEEIQQRDWIILGLELGWEFKTFITENF